MRGLLSLGSAMMVMLMWCQAAHAGVSPVLLKVTAQQESEERKEPAANPASSAPARPREFLSYLVELTNVSGRSPQEFRVRWAVLVRSEAEPHSQTEDAKRKVGPLRVVQGEHACTLKFGTSCSFHTHPIDLSGIESVVDGLSRTSRARILGYAIEVFSDDRVVASDIQPPDTKLRIQLATERDDDDKE